MNFTIVAVAFASLSLAQGGQVGNSELSGGASELTQSNRDAPEATANGEGVDANGDRRICRRIVVSGTHRYRRVCLTAEQWRQQDD